MFQLLNPIWLFSLAALAIPVLIHLWNVRPGKTLKVGSIALLGETTSKRARSFKLTDLLLLALRCLLLILLALLLSGPLWRSQLRDDGIKGWVLIEKEQFREAYAKFKPEVDSAINAGYEFHYFSPGFPGVDIEEALQDTSAKAQGSTKPSYWALLSSLNQQLPGGLPVLLITGNRLSRFYGNRPSVSYHVNWKTYGPADSASEKIASAFLTASDSLKIGIANNKPSGTSYRYETIHPKDANPYFQTDIVNGEPVVKFKNAKDAPGFRIDTSTLKIAIYTDKYQTDAGYLKAAISAIRTFTGRKIIITTLHENAVTAKEDWIFWLSDKHVAAQTGTTVFRYGTGKATSMNSWIYFGRNGLAEKTELFKRTSDANTGRDVIWEDGFGNPLLTKNDRAYIFYSHFDPDWSNLVWSQDFPKLLLPLLFSTEAEDTASDRRAIDTTQLIPQVSDAKTSSAASGNKETALSHASWLALLVVFIIERWLSYKQKTGLKYG